MRATSSRAGSRVDLLLIIGAAVFAAAVARYARVVDGDLTKLWTMIDLDIDRWGADLARRGGRLYDEEYQGFLPFLYTPFAALLFRPMTWVSYDRLKLVFTILNIAALVAAVWSAWVIIGVRGWQRQAGAAFIVAALALFTEPVQQTLSFGQINLLLMALIMLDFARPDASRLKGVGIGLATSIKLTPAIFIVYLLVTKRVGAARRAVVTFVATVGVGFAVYPSLSTRYWLERRFLDSNRVNTSYLGNQSLLATLQRFADGSDAIRPVWLLAAAIVGVIGVMMAARLHRDGRRLGGVMLCALTGLLVSPISWSHHWVYVAPAIVFGIEQVRRHRSLLLGVVLTALLVTFVSRPVPDGLLWRVPHEQDREFSWTFAETIIGNYYVLLGVVGLVLAGVVLTPRRREAQTSVACARLAREHTIEDEPTRP